MHLTCRYQSLAATYLGTFQIRETGRGRCMELTVWILSILYTCREADKTDVNEMADGEATPVQPTFSIFSLEHSVARFVNG